MKVYYGNFTSRKDVEEEFEVKLPRDIHIKFAHYDIDGYEGSAVVVYEQGGKLYMVEGSHCSCYGLEGQWQPAEETPATLATYELYGLRDAGLLPVWKRRFPKVAA
jgi:hypothetical protein